MKNDVIAHYIASLRYVAKICSSQFANAFAPRDASRAELSRVRGSTRCPLRCRLWIWPPLRLPTASREFLGNIRVYFAVCPFKPGIRYYPRASMPRACNENDIQVLLVDHAVEVDISEVQSGRSTPMAEQAWFHVLALERLLQERGVEEIDLPTDT